MASPRHGTDQRRTSRRQELSGEGPSGFQRRPLQQISGNPAIHPRRAIANDPFYAVNKKPLATLLQDAESYMAAVSVSTQQKRKYVTELWDAFMQKSGERYVQDSLPAYYKYAD